MCKSRKIPGYTLVGTSAVTLVAGIVMVALAIAFNKSSFLKSVDAIPDLVHKIVFWILLAGALLAVITGAFGVCVGLKPVKGCCNFSLGFFMTWSYLILIVLGVILVSLSSFTKLSIDTFCDAKEGNISIGGVSIKSPKFGASLDDLFGDIDNEYYNYQTRDMCTPYCPCKAPAENPWRNLTYRQLKDDYDRDIGFFKWNLDFRAEGAETAKECREKLKRRDLQSFGSLTSSFKDLTKDVTKTAKSLGTSVATLGGLIKPEINPEESFLTYFEKNFKCSGLCKKPLFFYSLPLSEGMP